MLHWDSIVRSMLPTIEELQKDLSGEGEEVSMVLSNLRRLESMAKELQELVQKHGGVPEWSQEKIAICNADLDSVYQNMKFNPEPLYEATVELRENVESPACFACLLEVMLQNKTLVTEAEYRGRKVTLNKPMQGDVKKFKVYVQDPKTGNVKKVNFGDPNMRIKKHDPERRKSFRARHNCDNPGPKTKARYWSCRKW
jgi:hypothetical protein